MRYISAKVIEMGECLLNAHVIAENVSDPF